MIPSFAVGRTQEMLYFIRQIKEEGRAKGHGNFKVYVDSPLANEATTIFGEHRYDCFDEEAVALTRKGINPLSFPGLKTSVTSDDSRAINFDEDCKVIISASGMCDAGRIKHHLKHNLWNKNEYDSFCGISGSGNTGKSSSGRSNRGEAVWRGNPCGGRNLSDAGNQWSCRCERSS